MIEPRVEEILLLAQQELEACGYLELAASGIVLTGGAASMPGMCEIAEDIFQMPVRLGLPVHGESRGNRRLALAEGGFAGVIRDPQFATGVGLVIWGATNEPKFDTVDATITAPWSGAPRKPKWRIFDRVRELF